MKLYTQIYAMKITVLDESGTHGYISLWSFCYFTNFQQSVCISREGLHNACNGFFTLFENEILLL